MNQEEPTGQDAPTFSALAVLPLAWSQALHFRRKMESDPGNKDYEIAFRSALIETRDDAQAQIRRRKS